MYKEKKGRPNPETIKKLYAWADAAEVAIQGVKPVLQHLMISYLAYDELEEEKNEDITFLLHEMIWLEKRLEEETIKNENFELVIH
jgi:hypothetical protein